MKGCLGGPGSQGHFLLLFTYGKLEVLVCTLCVLAVIQFQGRDAQKVSQISEGCPCSSASRHGKGPSVLKERMPESRPHTQTRLSVTPSLKTGKDISLCFFLKRAGTVQTQVGSPHWRGLVPFSGCPAPAHGGGSREGALQGPDFPAQKLVCRVFSGAVPSWEDQLCSQETRARWIDCLHPLTTFVGMRCRNWESCL